MQLLEVNGYSMRFYCQSVAKSQQMAACVHHLLQVIDVTAKVTITGQALVGIKN